MRELWLTKTNKIFFILVCIMTLSCNTNSNYTNNVKAIALESSHQAISNENNQQKIEDEELVLFLDNLKKALLEKQIDEIANNMINYPLEDEGPLYEMIYGDKVYEEVEGIEHHFGKSSLEKIKDLMKYLREHNYKA